MALTTGETATTHCGGFVGYTSFGSFTLTNSIYSPAAAAGNEKAVRSEMTFYRFNPNHTGTLTTANSYYTKTMGDAQGKELHSITISAGITIVPTGNATSFSASGITTNITATSADISWKGVEGCTYKVRYSKEATKYFCGFEEGMGEWTKIDADGDGYNWEYVNNPEGQVAHTGSAAVFSESYRSIVGPLKPDNWLISPQLTLGGKLKVCLKGQASNDYKEIFAIYLSTTGNSAEDFTITLVPETEATSKYQEYTADLSNYKGQQGYIAIRHFNRTDLLVLDLDDFGIYDVWTETTVNANSYTITDLNLGTEYEVEVQAAM